MHQLAALTPLSLPPPKISRPVADPISHWATLLSHFTLSRLRASIVNSSLDLFISPFACFFRFVCIANYRYQSPPADLSVSILSSRLLILLLFVCRLAAPSHPVALPFCPRRLEIASSMPGASIVSPVTERRLELPLGNTSCTTILHFDLHLSAACFA